MKFLMVILLAIFAVGLVHSYEDACSEMADACMNNLLNSLLGETAEAEICGDLRHAVNCLEDILDECIGAEHNEDIEDGVREVKSLLQENCQKGVIRPKPNIAPRHDLPNTEDISECLAKHEGYIQRCIYDGATEAMSILIAGATEDLVKCAMYGMMAGCYVERVGERCGDKAAEVADEQLAELPLEIANACQAAGGINTYSFLFQN